MPGGAFVTYEVTPPKYVQIVRTLQERIEVGMYPPGTMLPSESQLTAEFDASRTPVVRALNILRQDGWLESQQGKGYFVRGKPAAARRAVPSHVHGVLDSDESPTVELLHVGPVMASARIASTLSIAEGTPVYERRRLTKIDDESVSLASVYLPIDVAVASGMEKSDPMSTGLRRQLEARRGTRLDYATERITTRRPTADEARLLGIDEVDPVLSVLVTGFDTSGTAVLAVDALLPGDLHELEDTYPLT